MMSRIALFAVLLVSVSVAVEVILNAGLAEFLPVE